MMMAVTILHVLACVILVLVVLLQAGKGADIGAVFGGASTTIFGSSGAGNFLTRLTTGAAIVFMTTSLTLTYGSTRSTSSTLMPESGAGRVTGEPATGGPGTAAEDAGTAAEDAGTAGIVPGEAPGTLGDEPAEPASEPAQAGKEARGPAGEPAQAGSEPAAGSAQPGARAAPAEADPAPPPVAP